MKKAAVYLWLYLLFLQSDPLSASSRESFLRCSLTEVREISYRLPSCQLGFWTFYEAMTLKVQYLIPGQTLALPKKESISRYLDIRAGSNLANLVLLEAHEMGVGVISDASTRKLSQKKYVQMSVEAVDDSMIREDGIKILELAYTSNEVLGYEVIFTKGCRRGKSLFFYYQNSARGALRQRFTSCPDKYAQNLEGFCSKHYGLGEKRMVLVDTSDMEDFRKRNPIGYKNVVTRVCYWEPSSSPSFCAMLRSLFRCAKEEKEA